MKILQPNESCVVNLFYCSRQHALKNPVVLPTLKGFWKVINNLAKSKEKKITRTLVLMGVLTREGESNITPKMLPLCNINFDFPI